MRILLKFIYSKKNIETQRERSKITIRLVVYICIDSLNGLGKEVKILAHSLPVGFSLAEGGRSGTVVLPPSLATVHKQYGNSFCTAVPPPSLATVHK